ncbi:MAG: L-lactate dehydrogenase [Chloroflexi bacterium]|nr:L-lactate dehydrogenase [Chloroflexota bacterium]
MKVGIVGSGMVGATAAYALIMRGVGREIILVDVDQTRAHAEADDLSHAVPFASPLRVRVGNYSDLAGCRVVVITAGASQKPGETRLQLLGRNANIFRQIIPSILENAPDAILIVATNPVDALTHLTARLAKAKGIASSRVIGSGTTLDTARFRTLLAEQLGVDAQHVHGYVVGEHGDSEVLTWSLVTVGGIPLDEFCNLQKINLDAPARQDIDQRVRNAAYSIIKGKGFTSYGIGSALARIVQVILQDQRAILTVCTPVGNILGVCDVTVSLPHILGGEGIIATLPMPLNQAEQNALRKSAEVVCAAISSLE